MSAGGRHRRGKAKAERTDSDRADALGTETAGRAESSGQPESSSIPDWLGAAESDMSSEENNIDAGAALEDEGVPEVADESTPGSGDVPEPERPIAPTDEPTASTAYGTTAREQAEHEPLDERLEAEEPESPEQQPSEDRTERPDVGGPGIHVEDEPS